jgi:peptide/nickel transport system permease protein
MSLLKYALRRIIALIPIVFGVITLTFVLSRMISGDPVRAILAAAGIPRPAPHVYAAMARQLGLDQPIIIQYFRFMFELFTGQWGVSVSIARNQPVWNLVMQRLPRTIDLAVFSIAIAAFLGIKAGVISAKHRNKPADNVVRSLALIGVAIPVFFLGMLMQYYLGHLLKIFPSTGYKNFVYEDPPTVTGFYIIDALISNEWYKIWDYLYHLIMPVFCLAFVTLASITRQTRSSMLEVLEMDYVRTARAKGLKERDVINTHALKNAMIPTITVIGLNLAALLDGAVITESTFGLVGIGKLLIDAISLNDYWVLNAVVFFITLLYVGTNLAIDMIYAILDPRIRYK